MKHLEIALDEYMESELAGEINSPRILEYFSDCGFSSIEHTKSAWCSAFMNWVCFQAGLPRSGALNARGWLKVGETVQTPRMGDIVVFWRGSKDGWQGHVALFIREKNNIIYCLGGNQSNQVNISGYAKDKVLGYRRLVANSVPEVKKQTNDELLKEVKSRMK